MNSNGEICRDYWVLVEQGKIARIEAEPAPETLEVDRTIDVAHAVLMPGLINAHTHAPMSLFRNFGNDVALSTWLNEYIWPLEAHLTREDIRVGTALSVAEMLLGGTTTFVDMYDAEDVVGDVALDMGIRAVLGPGVTDFSIATKVEEIRQITPRHGEAGDMLRVLVAPHAIYTCSDETLITLRDLAEELDLGLHVHVSETAQEEEACRHRTGHSATQHLDALGLLGPRTILAHGVWLDETDIQTIAERQASVVYNPASNMKLASGFMPLESLRAAGVNVALGTDGPSSNNAQDLFRDMMLGSLIQKGHLLNPTVAAARTMLELATINGARAIGMEDTLGSIECGKRADLIIVGGTHPRRAPVAEDIEAALVYSTSSDDVSLVMINGKIVMENRQLPGIDLGVLQDRATHAWKELKKRGSRR